MLANITRPTSHNIKLFFSENMAITSHSTQFSSVFACVTVTQLFLTQRPETKLKTWEESPLYHTDVPPSLSDWTLLVSFVGLPACKMFLTKLSHELKMKQLIKLNKTKLQQPHTQLHLAHSNFSLKYVQWRN